MYRGASPIFDVPEFPPLRRVKPLPKRRRTSESISNIDLGDLTAPDDFLVSDPTADELANTLSTSMALQSYYLPIFSGVQDLLKTNDDTLNGTTTDFGGGMNGAEGHGSGRDDDEQGDGDYIDHLQQPGNTKKRKVPAANISPNGDAQDANSGGEDEPMDRSIPTGGRADAELVEFIPPPTPPETSTLRRGRTTPATNAGLQHKEMLKSRKRQLAAVLGALSHGDTLALDQALSSTYPFSKISMGHMGTDSDGPHVRLSRRPFRRMARAAKHVSGTAVSVDGDENARFPECDFTFEWPSATSERLVATKEEVAVLHARFEAELSRQAAKTAEAARQAAFTVNQMQSSKRGDRTQQRLRTGLLNGGAGNEWTPGSLDNTLLNGKGKGKKKKRSALANASNPHHLRNYVPSRLPHSGATHQGQAMTNAQSYLGPPPLRFLSAEIPPRRRKSQRAPTSLLTQLTNPEDEWICAFCEYSLFFGDEQSYRRSIRSRKKILSRRRRARERAAAAASGKKAVAPTEQNESVADDTLDGGYDGVPEQLASELSKAVKWRGERDRDKERPDMLG